MEIEDLPDVELLRRAVTNVIGGVPPRPRWAHVAHLFALGSASARSLCLRLGVDPDELRGDWPQEDDES